MHTSETIILATCYFESNNLTIRCNLVDMVNAFGQKPVLRFSAGGGNILLAPLCCRKLKYLYRNW